MAEDIYGMNAELLALVREVVKGYFGDRENTTNRPHVPRQLSQAPEMYVALTPAGGIPAMSEAGTGTGPDDPGYADCSLWDILRTGTTSELIPLASGKIQTVHNISTDAIPGNAWIAVSRTKGGAWLPVTNDSSPFPPCCCSNATTVPPVPGTGGGGGVTGGGGPPPVTGGSGGGVTSLPPGGALAGCPPDKHSVILNDGTIACAPGAPGTTPGGVGGNGVIGGTFQNQAYGNVALGGQVPANQQSVPGVMNFLGQESQRSPISMQAGSALLSALGLQDGVNGQTKTWNSATKKFVDAAMPTAALTASLTTTDATTTAIQTIAIANNTTVKLTADITAVNNGAGASGTQGDSLGRKIVRTIKRTGGGGAALVGVTPPALDDEHDIASAAWQTAWAVSGNNAVLNVTGAATTTIKWYSEVTQAPVSQ